MGAKWNGLPENLSREISASTHNKNGRTKNFQIWENPCKIELITNAIDIVSLLEVQRFDFEDLEIPHKQDDSNDTEPAPEKFEFMEKPGKKFIAKNIFLIFPENTETLRKSGGEK